MGLVRERDSRRLHVKSMLMGESLVGRYGPDEGEILVRGERVHIRGPNDSIARGIGMVHQHFMLVPVMTVTENVMIGNETIHNGIFLDHVKVAKRIREISEQYSLDVDPDAYIKDLPVGIQQRVEIIKVLYREADILILDEPTAVLTPQEVEGLFKILKLLISKGKSIIFITHKLKEVMALANRITVLRAGRTVGTVKPDEVNPEKLASMMVGREADEIVRREPGTRVVFAGTPKGLESRLVRAREAAASRYVCARGSCGSCRRSRRGSS